MRTPPSASYVSGTTGLVSTFSNYLNNVPYLVYNSSAPTATNGQGGPFQGDINLNLKTTLGTLLAGEDITNNWLAVAGKTNVFSLTATSPSSATTTAQTALTGLGGYRSLTIFATLTGAT